MMKAIQEVETVAEEMAQGAEVEMAEARALSFTLTVTEHDIL